MNLESLLHCNHLINAFKNFTKIWGCHVMFPITFIQKYLLVVEDFELYINFANLVQWVPLHYNLFKYLF